MRNLVIFTIVLFWIFGIQFSVAQKTTFSPSEIHEDLDFLNKHLKKWHPTYYSYTPHLVMDEFYQKLKLQTDTNQPMFELMKQVRMAVSKIGCGHIGVDYPKKHPTVDSALVLPFDANIIKDRIFVRKYLVNDSALQIGDEILSINGIKADSLIRILSNIITSDGLNLTHQSYLIEKAFFIRFFRFFGPIETSKVNIIAKDGTPKNINLKSIYRKSYDFYNRNTIDSSRIVIKGKNINLQKTAINDQTFLIDFNSFSGPKLRKNYREIFKYLKKNNAQNLIIDLRDNGGGNVFGGFNFMKFLIKQPIQFANLSRKPNLTIINPAFKAGLFERITPLFFMTNPLQYPNKNGWNHTFIFLRHFKNHYHNNLYVLTNGMTFSMAAITATLLKNKSKAIIIGEETGGSSYASRGMAQGKIILPNSKIQVSLNVYQLKYGKNPDSGRGLMPDYPIEYNFQERYTKRDLEMEKVKELILK